MSIAERVAYDRFSRRILADAGLEVPPHASRPLLLLLLLLLLVLLLLLLLLASSSETVNAIPVAKRTALSRKRSSRRGACPS